MKEKLFRMMVLALVGILALVSILPALAAAGDITLVSKNSSGEQGNEYSEAWSISADGRYVAFDGIASNLDSRCDNGHWHVYVHDKQLGKTRCVSISSAGVQGNDDSFLPTLSGDGRYVAFQSYASNLVEDDTNGNEDIFIHDIQTGETIRISVRGENTQMIDGHSSDPYISASGAYVAFVSTSEKLVEDDSNNLKDIFVRDLREAETICITCTIGTKVSNGISDQPSMSANGQLVVFQSYASNLVSGDFNTKQDVFVHDISKGKTALVSLATSSEQGNGNSYFGFISNDGRYVTFSSLSDNLVDGDLNEVRDIFVRDLIEKTTTRVSISSDQEEADDHSHWSSISSDGRFVAFASAATNLDPVDNDEMSDIFLHDRVTGETTLISLALDGRSGNGHSWWPKISADGCFVAFSSEADDLVPDDQHGFQDAFVWSNSACGPPTITSNGSTTFTIGSMGSFNVETEGFPIPVIAYTGSLPDGVTLVDEADGTALLSGIPSPGSAGEYILEITADNGFLPNATQNFTLTVKEEFEETSIFLPLVIR